MHSAFARTKSDSEKDYRQPFLEMIENGTMPAPIKLNITQGKVLMNKYLNFNNKKILELMNEVTRITDNIDNSSDIEHSNTTIQSFEALRTIQYKVKEKNTKISPEDLVELSELINKFCTLIIQLKNSSTFMRYHDNKIQELPSIAVEYATLIQEFFTIEQIKISYDEHAHNFTTKISDLKNELESIKQEKFEQEHNFTTSIQETEKKLQTLEFTTGLIESKIQDEIDKSLDYYEKTSTEINEKKSQINAILEIASSDVLSGEHGRNAATEETTANRLRYSSIFCMIMILGILGFTVWESTKSSFSWDVALFRVSLAFLLSVPAAYLARESAKHREQQYYYRQTALNLKAISPYIASLPEQEQHKLKIDIAASIFSGREAAKFDSDPYPINTQELLMSIINKLEMPSKKTQHE